MPDLSGGQKFSFPTLFDFYREVFLNPEEKRYTWRQNRPEIHCRLDFFLVSLSIAGRISNADILPGCKADHSMCKIDINYHSHPRGFWKLNCAFLNEVDYVNAIKSTITKTVSQYENHEGVDEVLLWEMLKLEIRDASMKYSEAKMKMKNVEANNECELATLERRLKKDVNNNKEVLEEQIRLKKNELESIMQYKTKGAIIRS